MPSHAIAIRDTLDEWPAVSCQKIRGTYRGLCWRRDLACDRDSGTGRLAKRPKECSLCEWIGGSSIDRHRKSPIRISTLRGVTVPLFAS
jgi:hypothetical protein